MAFLSLVESSEDKPWHAPRQILPASLQAMVDTDQKKMTDDEGKMEQMGRSRDRNVAHSVLAAYLEEGPKHSISASFGEVPKQ
jgi:hypothetical protein